MTLILSIALGLIFVLLIGVMACGIVAFARDHCDETLPSANVGADQAAGRVIRPIAPKGKQPIPPTSPQMPHSRPSRPRDSHGRFTKSTKQ